MKIVEIYTIYYSTHLNSAVGFFPNTFSQADLLQVEFYTNLTYYEYKDKNMMSYIGPLVVFPICRFYFVAVLSQVLFEMSEEQHFNCPSYR